MMFNFEIQSRDVSEQLVIISMSGYLDSKVALDFYEFVSEIDEPYSRCIFNCEGIIGISSLGLSIFIRIRKKFIQKNIIPIITGINSEISDLFELLGFGKLFYITKNIPSAKNILSTLHPIPQVTVEERPPLKPIIKNNTKKSERENISEISIESLGEDEVYVPVFLSETKVPGLGMEQDDGEENIPKPDFEKKRDYEFSIPFITKNNSPEKEELREAILIEEENRGYAKFNELVINCGNCSTKMLIKKQGKQKCPSCGAAFLLRQSGSISTIEKI